MQHPCPARTASPRQPQPVLTRSRPPKIYLGLGYSTVEKYYRQGLISERDWRLFNLLWTWSAPRYGGLPGMQQDRFYKKMGPEALGRRRDRALAWLEKLQLRAVEAAKS